MSKENLFLESGDRLGSQNLGLTDSLGSMDGVGSKKKAQPSPKCMQTFIGNFFFSLERESRTFFRIYEGIVSFRIGKSIGKESRLVWPGMVAGRNQE